MDSPPAKDTPLPFGLMLRRLRLAAGLTHEVLAERAGLGARTISDLERGVSRAPRADTLALLIGALNLTPDQRMLLETCARQDGASSRTTAVTGNRKSNLPRQLTSFVGRDHETRAVLDLLHQPDIRLVTLTGPGGVGKTRLMHHVGSKVDPDVPDGVIAVDLASVTNPNEVGEAIRLAAGAGEGRSMSTEHLVGHIGEQRLALLLDSFEHVLAAAPLVAELLRCCPNLNVLVTSRAPLRISGEQEFPVPTLPVPGPQSHVPVEQMAQVASVQLFVDRARRVVPDFILTSANAEWVAAICRRLDGLPLALELAAARTKSLPPRELLQRLEVASDAPVLRLLGPGPRDAPARHQSLRQTIAWSFSLLSETDRMLFRRLAVFVGGCTRAAAEAICTPKGVLANVDVSPAELAPSALLDIDECLSSLIDQSLLYRREGPDGEQRFHMLDTIREFAEEQLAQTGEGATLKRRHARYYLNMVESTGALLFASPPKRAASAAEQGNIQAALSWLVRNG